MFSAQLSFVEVFQRMAEICGQTAIFPLQQMTNRFAQSAYQEFGFQRVGLKQTLDSKGREFSCPMNFIGSLPESSTQGLSIGKLLIGGLGALRRFAEETTNPRRILADEIMRIFRGPLFWGPLIISLHVLV